jgi:hypothetical protein
VKSQHNAEMKLVLPLYLYFGFFLNENISIFWPQFKSKSSLFVPFSNPITSLSLHSLKNVDETITNVDETAAYNYTEIPQHKKGFILARLASWIIKKIVLARTQDSSNLKVSVSAESNSDILLGRVNHIELKFDTIRYGQLYCSGGGRIVLEGF